MGGCHLYTTQNQFLLDVVYYITSTKATRAQFRNPYTATGSITFNNVQQ